MPFPYLFPLLALRGLIYDQEPPTVILPRSEPLVLASSNVIIPPLHPLKESRRESYPSTPERSTARPVVPSLRTSFSFLVPLTLYLSSSSQEYPSSSTGETRREERQCLNWWDWWRLGRHLQFRKGKHLLSLFFCVSAPLTSRNTTLTVVLLPVVAMNAAQSRPRTKLPFPRKRRLLLVTREAPRSSQPPRRARAVLLVLLLIRLVARLRIQLEILPRRLRKSTFCHSLHFLHSPPIPLSSPSPLTPFSRSCVDLIL